VLLLFAGQLVESSDQAAMLFEGVTYGCRLDERVGQEIKAKSELFGELCLQLLNEGSPEQGSDTSPGHPGA